MPPGCDPLTNSQQTQAPRGRGICEGGGFLDKRRQDIHRGQTTALLGVYGFIRFKQTKTKDNQGSSADGRADGIEELLSFVTCKNDAVPIFN